MKDESPKNEDKPSSFFQELKRRHVFTVGGAYVVISWLIVQVASIVFPAFEAPPWMLQLTIAICVAGFPVALILAWIYDLTRKGPVNTNKQDAIKLSLSERRQMTVLYGRFEWLTSDTDEEVDPEFLKDSLPELRTACAASAERFGGHLTRMRADEFVIYFGYPDASEFDARAAVGAGLDILYSIHEHSERLRPASGNVINTSIGIDTGVAVVEKDKRSEAGFNVVGGMAGVAEWLQSFVDFGQLGISQRTAELVRGYFELLDLGKHTRPKSSSEISVYQVLKTSGAKTRIQARGQLAHLAGRDLELATLTQRWEQTQDGQGQVVLLTGDAGLGKSRLVHELMTHVQTAEKYWLTECICSPDHTNRALHPAAAIIHKSLVDAQHVDKEERLDRLVTLVTEAGLILEDTVPLLASLLGIPFEHKFADLQLSPQRQRERTMETLLELLFVRADKQPMLLVIEDLHWADPSFMELVQNIVEQGPSSQILTVCTTRPETAIPWAQRTHVSSIGLTPLVKKDSKKMILSMSDVAALPKSVINELVETAQGNPLFAEELARGVLDSVAGSDPAAADMSAVHIPATLQESLMSRLDRLASTAKMVARIGATLGKQFSYTLIESFARTLHLTAIQDELRALVAADILYQRGIPPNAKYTFKHVLFQEAAYQSLLRKERVDYHQKIAKLLLEEWPEVCERNPDQLARHLEAAGKTEDAIENWLRAGQVSARQSAMLEASRYLQHALKLLNTLPTSAERDLSELDIQISLGPVLMAVRGYSDRSVLDTYERAEELCDATDLSPRLAAVLFGLWTYSVVSGALPNALRLGDRLLEVADTSQNEDLIIESNVLLGVTRTYTGKMQDAYEHLQIASARYDAESHGGHAYVYGQDPYMASLSYSAMPLWWSGKSEEGGKLADEAIEFARGIGHPRSLAFALANGARCHLKRGDYVRTIACGSEANTLSDEYGFPDFSAMGQFHRHAAEFYQEQTEETLTQMQSSLNALLKVGNSLSMPYYHSVVADGLSRLGHHDEAGQHVQKAEAALSRHETDTDEAELYRVKGLVMWRLGQERHEEDTIAAGIATVEKSIALAEEQGAVSWQHMAQRSLEKIR